MKQQLLLLEDVEGLGRSGEIASARPGFIRNYLLPRKKAIIATANTLKMQEKLIEQRRQKAIIDFTESEKLRSDLADLVLEFYVKVDPEGKMYGSVNVAELMKAASEKGFKLEKSSFPSSNFSIKILGRSSVSLKLKEGVTANLLVDIFSEGIL